MNLCKKKRRTSYHWATRVTTHPLGTETATKLPQEPTQSQPTHGRRRRGGNSSEQQTDSAQGEPRITAAETGRYGGNSHGQQEQRLFGDDDEETVFVYAGTL